MTYAQGFNLSTPTGLEEANTLDEIIRNVKIALNERFVDILGVDLSSATDPQRVTKIVIPSTGMTVRDSSDANSLIAFSNSGAAIRNASFTGTAPTLPSGSILINPTLSGTLTGGTVAPTTLNVPSGTTLDSPTLNNSTFTGTITGINTNPVVTSIELGPDVTINYTTNTTILSASVSAGSYMVFGRVYGIAAASTTNTACAIVVTLVNSLNSVTFFSQSTDIGGGLFTGTVNVFGTFTMASSGTISMRAIASGGLTTATIPTVYGDVGSTSYTGLYIMRIA
jgi:hypothetical protein